MNAEFINPFITVLINAIETMAQLTLKLGKPSKKNGDASTGDISDLIGLATPIVVSGKNHILDYQVGGKKIVVPFSCAAGNVYL